MITNSWTDPDTLEVAADEIRRAADINAQLGNLKWLHARPRFTLAHSTDQTIAADSDVTLEFDTDIEDVGGWYDSGSPTVAVVPEDGVYLLVASTLWDGTGGGNQRKCRIARDGDLIRGDSAPAVSFAEHSLSIITAASEGEALSVVMYHDDSSTHDVLSDSSPWRSPLFMGVWLSPYIASL